jgi:hypothetical protein
MKGIVFNLLEQCVTDAHGADTWDDLLESAGVDGAYTSLGNYDDEELIKIVAAASERLSIAADEVERWFGRAAMAPLAKLYPEFFECHSRPCGFIQTLNEVIHPEVRKLYPGADVPVFRFDPTGEGQVIMGYRSHRRMCAFAEGLIEGAAHHFGEQVAIVQSTCMKRGDDECLLHCTFEKKEDA